MEVDRPHRRLQKEFEQELGDDYRFDDKALYLIKDNEKYDIIPEIINGKNIADYIDPDIFEKLEQLEREEELREAAGFYHSDSDELDAEEEEIRKQAVEIRKQKKIRLQEHRMKKGPSNAPVLPRKAAMRVEKFSRAGQKRKLQDMEVEMDDDGDEEMLVGSVVLGSWYFLRVITCSWHSLDVYDALSSVP